MSQFAVAVNVANLYAAPDSDSEVVTQAIYGALVIVEKEENDWRFVRTEDRYQGWIQSVKLAPASDLSDYFVTSIATLFAEVFSQPDAHSEMRTKLVVSTRVAVAHRPEVGDFVPILLPDDAVGYVHKACLNVSHDGAIVGPDLLDESALRAVSVSNLKRQIFRAVGVQAVRVAVRFIGTPYLWGGCTPFGLDCSGLVQLCYKLSGVQLLRDADIQFTDKRFERVEKEKSLSEGDFDAGDLLTFSRKRDGQVTHIGLAMGDGRFIHASGKRGVAIDSCESEEYGQTFVGAVRLSADANLAVEAA